MGTYTLWKKQMGEALEGQGGGSRGGGELWMEYKMKSENQKSLQKIYYSILVAV